MDVQTLESAVVRERLAAGDFEAAFTLSGSVPIWLQQDFGEESPIGYRNARLLELIDRAAETSHPDEQDEIYREIAGVLRADQPITYLHWWVVTTAVHRRVEGLSDPWRTDPLTHMADLWIADEP
jgi:ABC-type transport system substrate-binding protein